jgi:DNA-binding NarL/FixJ family response regulator
LAPSVPLKSIGATARRSFHQRCLIDDLTEIKLSGSARRAILIVSHVAAMTNPEEGPMALTQRINVLLRHRHTLVRAGIVATLLRQPDLAVLGWRSDAACMREDGALLSSESNPDVIVADYESGLDNISARARAGSTLTDALPKVLIVTNRAGEAEIRLALEVGVHGYLLDGCSPEELVDSVHAVQRGMRHVSELAGRRMAESLTHEALTGREVEVLGLMASGCSNKAIGKRLNITAGTVKTHGKAILMKLDATSRTEATAIASRRGLLVDRAQHGGTHTPWLICGKAL